MEVGRKMSALFRNDAAAEETLLNLKETELCLGLPGAAGESAAKVTGKRGISETVDLLLNLQSNESTSERKLNSRSSAVATSDLAKPPAKAQVVGWPPVRSFRKNATANQRTCGGQESTAADKSSTFVKVSIDGAPFLRKVDLKSYRSYRELSVALSNMFSSFTIGCRYGGGSQSEEEEGMGMGMIDFMNERSKLMMDLHNASDYALTYQDKDGDWMLVGDVPWEMFVESCNRIRIVKGSEAIGLAPRGGMEGSKTSRC